MQVGDVWFEPHRIYGFGYKLHRGEFDASELMLKGAS